MVTVPILQESPHYAENLFKSWTPGSSWNLFFPSLVGGGGHTGTSSSLLDIYFKCHFWMSLFDVNFEYSFGGHFKTAMLVKTVFMSKPLEGAPWGAGWHKTHLDGHATYRPNCPLKILMIFFLIIKIIFKLCKHTFFHLCLDLFWPKG